MFAQSESAGLGARFFPPPFRPLVHPAASRRFRRTFAALLSLSLIHISEPTRPY